MSGEESALALVVQLQREHSGKLDDLLTRVARVEEAQRQARRPLLGPGGLVLAAACLAVVAPPLLRGAGRLVAEAPATAAAK